MTEKPTVKNDQDVVEYDEIRGLWRACRFRGVNPENYPTGYGECPHDALDALLESEAVFDSVAIHSGYVPAEDYEALKARVEDLEDYKDQIEAEAHLFDAIAVGSGYRMVAVDELVVKRDVLKNAAALYEAEISRLDDGIDYDDPDDYAIQVHMAKLKVQQDDIQKVLTGVSTFEAPATPGGPKALPRKEDLMSVPRRLLESILRLMNESERVSWDSEPDADVDDPDAPPDESRLNKLPVYHELLAALAGEPKKL